MELAVKDAEPHQRVVDRRERLIEPRNRARIRFGDGVSYLPALKSLV